MQNNDYIDYVLDILEPFGNIRSRKMFGGYGIYKEDIFFALIIDGILRFKVDDTNRSDYEECGCEPFRYTGKKDKVVVMNYWEVPIDVLENRDLLEQWVDKALDVARRAKKSKKK